jgi:nitroreductase
VGGAAAAIMIVIPDTEDGSATSLHYDAGQATMSIMLAAAGFGIGSAHASVHDQELARHLLDLPADRSCAALISLGYPKDRPLSPIKHHDRRPFDEVVHRERW